MEQDDSWSSHVKQVAGDGACHVTQYLHHVTHYYLHLDAWRVLPACSNLQMQRHLQV